MSRQLPLLLGTFVLAGCTFDQEPPEQFLCTSAKPACPVGQRCNTVLGSCVAAVDSRVPDAGGDGRASDLSAEDLPVDDLPRHEGGLDGSGVDGDALVDTGPDPDRGQPLDREPPADTLSPDTSKPVCGDLSKNGAEACDGQDFGGVSCASMGFDEGELSCTASCTIVASGCRNCTAPIPPAGVTPSLIVSAATGNDATAVEDCLPYRTITAALADASNGDVIWVAPGLYNASLGETFPLRIPSGVTLVGNEATKGNAGGGVARTAIEGSGGFSTLSCSPAVLFNSTSGRVSGFQIKSPVSNGCAIGGFRTTAIISNNYLTGLYWNIKILEGQATAQNAQITNNLLGGATYGIWLQGASPKIRGNTFNTHTSSVMAIYNQSATPSIPDLGTDHQTDRGENTFTAGKAIYLASNVSIYALGNTWPNYQDPTCSSSGVIDVTGLGKVYWGHLAEQSCPP